MPVPSSLDWMESVDAKFARAVEHFQSYNTDSRTFFQTVERNFRLVSSADGSQKWLSFWESDHFPPIRLSTIVGDVLFNLRSSLDHIVCGLARKAGDGVNTDCKFLEFPISLTPDAFASAVKGGRLAGVTDEAILAIRSVQPFHLSETTRRLHPLALLHNLNNIDKHRAVHITTGASQDGEIALLDSAGAMVHHLKLPPKTDFGALVINLPTTIPDNVRLQARGSFVINFRGHELLIDREVHEVLATCINFVELKVIGLMRPFFRDTK